MKDWGEKLEEKIRMLPDSPGCYLMKDAEGTIIYVGKAVNLKNRVRSYFRDTAHTPKVAAMISHIDDFEILLCETNLEALMLECNLIKRHRPYYNILLKDDKHYPYLRVNMKEPFPRLEITRRLEKDGAVLAGLRTGLEAVSPLGVLDRGYALVYDEKKALVTGAEEAARKRDLWIRFADGEIPVRRKDPKDGGTGNDL